MSHCFYSYILGLGTPWRHRNSLFRRKYRASKGGKTSKTPQIPGFHRHFSLRYRVSYFLMLVNWRGNPPVTPEFVLRQKYRPLKIGNLLELLRCRVSDRILASDTVPDIELFMSVLACGNPLRHRNSSFRRKYPSSIMINLLEPLRCRFSIVSSASHTGYCIFLC